MYDALIIGGGPSGATIGYLLAQAGWAVAIVEKKIFPRRKVCGEFISATTLSLLSQLGIYDRFCSLAGSTIKNIELYTEKTIISANMPKNKHDYYKWGRAIGREYLDTFLLEAAKNAGAIIWQPWCVSNIEREGDHFVCNIKAEDKTKELVTGIIIMAHGSWEKQAWENHGNVHTPSDLLAFKAHFTSSGLKSDTMPVIAFPGGYGGMVQTDNGRTSFSCCIRHDYLVTIRREYAGLHAGEALIQHLIKTNRGVRNCLSSAQPEGPWLSVGPLKPGIRSSYKNNIFYVGNIAGEAHPIIAEGISMAIQSAWMLAKILVTSKNKREVNWVLQAGNDYKSQWRKKFALRIYSAALFARLASNKTTINLLLPFVRFFPKILSSSAKLSGKINML